MLLKLLVHAYFNSGIVVLLQRHEVVDIFLGMSAAALQALIMLNMARLLQLSRAILQLGVLCAGYRGEGGRGVIAVVACYPPVLVVHIVLGVLCAYICRLWGF